MRAALFALLALVAIASADIRATMYSGHKTMKCLASTVSEHSMLQATVKKHGLDVWAESSEGIVVLADSEEEQILSALGCTVLNPDVGATISREIEEQAAAKSAPLDFWDAYRTYDEFRTFTQGLAQTYPQLARFIPSIGKTSEGRDIFALVITSSVNAGPTKPKFAFNSLIHAREWVTGSSVSWAMNEFLSKYGVDDEITEILDNLELHVVPVLNPDGYVWTHTRDRLWRRNRRQTPTCLGVDCNRNYPYQWQRLAACSDTFSGPSAGSEPEIQSWTKYMSGLNNLVAFLDLHAYSQLFMYPWGYTTARPPAPINAIMAAAGNRAGNAIRAVNNRAFAVGNIATTIYVATGSSADWTYGQLNVSLSFAVEARPTQFDPNGFILPVNQIRPAAQELFAAFLTVSQDAIALVKAGHHNIKKF